MLLRRKASYIRFSSLRARKLSCLPCHALGQIGGGCKAHLQIEQHKTPLPDSAWVLQAVSQSGSVSFICFFQIGFLFNGKKAFILMESLPSALKGEAEMQSRNFISGRLGSSSPCSDEQKHRQLPAPSAFQSKAQRQSVKFAFLPFLNSAIRREFPG